jgi:Carbohydrate binding domain
MAEKTLGINNLAPGFQYDVRVRAIFKGTPSEWGPVETIDVFSNTSSGTGDKVPAAPTSAGLVTPTIDSFILNWTAPTLNADGSTLNDMKDYVIEVSDDNFATTVDAVYYMTEHQKPSDLTAVARDRTFEFTFKMNKDLYSGSPKAVLYFRVYARDATNNRSAPLSGTGTNAAPTAPTSLTATAVVGGANISWGGGTSNDIVAYTLKYSTSAGFNPVVAGTEAYRGNLTNYSFSGTTGTPYYFRVGSVDVFGTTSWYATEATATPLPTVTYNTPAAPTVFTNAYVGANYRIGWTASASAAVDVEQYRVDITANSVTKSFYTTGVFVDIDPNMGRDFGTAWPYTPSAINVYTIGPSGLTSSALAGSGIVTAPATPTAPALTSTIAAGGIGITWSAPSDPNKVLKEVQVYANTATTASPTNAVYAGDGTGFTYSISPIFNGTYYFKSRVLDIFGRFSGYSAEDTEAVSSIGVPTALSTSSALDPADTVNSTAIITVNWTNPSTITYNGTKIRYRLTGGLWTEVDVGSFGGPSAAATYNLRNLVPGSTYIIDVAAYDFKGTLGAWTSASAGQVAASDSTAPSSALSPTTSTGATSILVSWTGVNTTTDKDALNGNGRYDVELNTLSNFTGTAIKQTAATGASLEPMSAAFTGLTGGTTYYARVRAVDWTGNAGAWNVYGGGTPTATVVGAGALVYSTPNNASAITDSWVGANYRISWTAATGTATDILKYKVDVLANAVTKTYYTTGLAIEIDPASGKTFGTAWPYTPTSITVTTIGPTNLASTGVVKSSAFTAAPATPTAPPLTSTFNSSGIALSWSAVSDPNAIIHQIEVYANTATTASPTNAVYSGIGTGFNYSVSPLFSGTYYFKSRVLDKFGRYSSYSAEDTEALVSVGLPTAMTLTSTLDEADPTNRTAKVAVAFTINNTTSYGGTKIRYKVSSTSTWTEIDLGSFGGPAAGAVTYYLRGLIPGAIYNVEIAHYSFAGVAGTWAVPASSPVTAASDTTGPVSALSPTHTAGLTSLSVNWTGVNTGTNPTDSDAVNGNGRYDVEIATNTAFNTGVVRKVMTTGASAAAMSTTFGGLTAGTVYYSRVRAVDITGNVGAWYPVGGVGTETTATIGTVTVSYSTPNPPTSLVESWVGSSYRIAWTASTTPAATDIDRYRVEVTTTDSTARTFFTSGVFLDITPDMGKGFTTWPSVGAVTDIKVWSIGPSGLVSATSLNKTTGFATAPTIPTAPVIVTPVIDAGGIYLSWPPVAGATRYEIYGTGTGSTSVIYSGNATFFRYALPSTYSGTYYFRGRSEDVFGRITAAYGGEVNIVATSTLTAPTSTATGGYDTNDPTNRTGQITLTSISGPGGPTLAGFKVRYRKSTDTAGQYTELDVNKSATTYILRGLSTGVAYTVEMASYDVMGRVSGTWVASTGSPVTITADITAPSQPTAPSISANTMQILVTQAFTKQAGGALEGDVKEFEVYAGTAAAPTNKIGTIPYSGTNPLIAAVFNVPASGASGSAQTWYARVKAVDWNGNASAYSPDSSGSVNLIANANIADATILSAKIVDLVANKITAGTGIINSLDVKSTLTVGDLGTSTAGEIRSENYVAGTTGWRIGQDAAGATVLEINSGTVKAAALEIGGRGVNVVPPLYSGFEGSPFKYLQMSGLTAATVASDTAQKYMGASALKVTTSSATNNVFLGATGTDYNLTVKPSTTYIVSAYFYHATGSNQTVSFRYKDSAATTTDYTTLADGGATNGTANIPTATWTRMYTSFTTPASLNSGLLGIRNFNIASGSYWVDGVMLEEKVGNQTKPSAFTAAPMTVIDGDQITTGTVKADKVSLGLFSSNKLENGSFEKTGANPQVPVRTEITSATPVTIPGWTMTRLPTDTDSWAAHEWGNNWSLDPNLAQNTSFEARPTYVDCTITDAGDTILSYSHGLVAGRAVMFKLLPSGTGLTINTVYYVAGTITTDNFQVSATYGGAAIVLTNTGAGTYIVNQPPDAYSIVSSGTSNGSMYVQQGNAASLNYKFARNYIVKGRFLENNKAVVVTEESTDLAKDDTVDITGIDATFNYSGTVLNSEVPGDPETGEVTKFEVDTVATPPYLKVTTLSPHSLVQGEIFKIEGLDTEDRSQWDGYHIVDGVPTDPYSFTFRSSKAFNVTFQISIDTVTYNNHGLVIDDRVLLRSVSGTTGLSTSTLYYAKAITTNTFKLSTTPSTGANTTVDMLTADGTGTALFIPATTATGVKISYHDIAATTYTKTNADIAYSEPAVPGVMTFGKSLLTTLTGATTAGAYYGISQTIGIDAGTVPKVSLSFWYKISSTARLIAYLGNTGLTSSVNSGNLSATTWTKATLEYTPLSTDTEIRFDLRTIAPSATNTGTSAIDGVQLIEGVTASLREFDFAWTSPARSGLAKVALKRGTGTVACTFQDTGDTVTSNGHGMSNGDIVVFNTVVTTTGISAATPYYVVGAATNTFQVATTLGGSALALTTIGTGTYQMPGVKIYSDPIAVTGGQEYAIGAYYYGTRAAGIRQYVEYSATSTFTSPTRFSLGMDRTALADSEAAESAISDLSYWTPNASGYARLVFANSPSLPNSWPGSTWYLEDVWFMQTGATSGELTDAGIRLFDSAGKETISLMSDSGDGGDFIQLGSGIYIDGRSNKISTPVLYVERDFRVDGNTIDDLLWEYPRGLVARGSRTTDSEAGGIAEKEFMELRIPDLDPARGYRIWSSPIVVSNTNTIASGGAVTQIFLKYDDADPGAKPQTGDTGLLQETRAVVNNTNNQAVAAGFNKYTSPSVDLMKLSSNGDFRILMSFIGGAGAAAGTVQIRSNVNDQRVHLVVEDIGPDIADTGVERGAADGNTTQKLTTKIFKPQWVGSYQGNGTLLGSNHIYQGDGRSYGNERSAIRFPVNSTSVPDAAVIVKVEVYLYCFDSALSSGVTGLIGLHREASGGAPGTWANVDGKSSTTVPVDFSKKEGAWIDITNLSARVGGLQAWGASSNRYTGITVGPGVNTGAKYVGGWVGRSGSAPGGGGYQTNGGFGRAGTNLYPRLRITYKS